MRRNRIVFLCFIIISILLCGVLLPHDSFADLIPTSPPQTMITEPSGIDKNGGLDHRPVNYICPNPDTAKPKDYGLTVRLIPCIFDVIAYATSKVIVPFSEFFSEAITAAFVLAIALWGVTMLSGNPVGITQTGMTLALKIGAVIALTNAFGASLITGGLYSGLLDSSAELLNIMASPVANPTGVNGITIWKNSGCTIGTFSAQDIMMIWNLLDCYIELLLGGIFSPTAATTTIGLGILGFIVGVLFTGTVGWFIAMIGFYLVAVTVFTISRTVYIFLTAYLALSFMVVISPIFIPCILFNSTKDLFDGWLRLLITFFVQPIFLFGYLILFLVAFNTTIFHSKHSLYYAIAGDASNADDFKIGDWLDSNGIYVKKFLGKGNVLVDIGSDYKLTHPVGSPDPSVESTKVDDNIPIRPNSTDIPFGFGDGLNPLNFFQTGMQVNAIDWKKLAQIAHPAEYAAAPDKDKYTKEYMISIFFAFLMAVIVMYIFYSLLEFMPFIGSASMGHVGMMPTLGTGQLAMPGTKK